MKSNLSNEYYKRKLINVVKESRLYTERFDGVFVSLSNKKITLEFKDWFVDISGKKQLEYTSAINFDYLLSTLDSYIELIEGESR